MSILYGINVFQKKDKSGLCYQVQLGYPITRKASLDLGSCGLSVNQLFVDEPLAKKIIANFETYQNKAVEFDCTINEFGRPVPVDIRLKK